MTWSQWASHIDALFKGGRNRDWLRKFFLGQTTSPLSEYCPLYQPQLSIADLIVLTGLPASRPFRPFLEKIIGWLTQLVSEQIVFPDMVVYQHAQKTAKSLACVAQSRSASFQHLSTEGRVALFNSAWLLISNLDEWDRLMSRQTPSNVDQPKTNDDNHKQDSTPVQTLVTNLDRRFSKFQLTVRNLSHLSSQIKLERHPAVDGHSVNRNLMLPQVQHNKGAIGCYLSTFSRFLAQQQEHKDEKNRACQVDLNQLADWLGRKSPKGTENRKTNNWVLNMEDDAIAAPFATRDLSHLRRFLSMTRDIADPFFHTIWIGYHLPRPERLKVLESTHARATFGRAAKNQMLQSIGGTFAFLTHSSGAAAYLDDFQRETENGQTTKYGVDGWLFRHQAEHQLAINAPVFVSEYFNGGDSTLSDCSI